MPEQAMKRAIRFPRTAMIHILMPEEPIVEDHRRKPEDNSDSEY
jgi:hypothetical protein